MYAYSHSRHTVADRTGTPAERDTEAQLVADAAAAEDCPDATDLGHGVILTREPLDATTARVMGYTWQGMAEVGNFDLVELVRHDARTLRLMDYADAWSTVVTYGWSAPGNSSRREQSWATREDAIAYLRGVVANQYA